MAIYRRIFQWILQKLSGLAGLFLSVSFYTVSFYTIAFYTAAFLVIACLALATARPACAGLAFSFPDPSFGTPSVQGNDGFQFRPTTPIIVTALGYYDRDQNGLSLIHTVGIYDVATKLQLIKTDVLQGNGSRLDGLFRFNDIVPLTLDAGRSYMLVGFHPGNIADNAAKNPAGLTIAPEISFEGYFTSTNPILFYPTTPDTGTFFGPNFQFQPIAVPEPTSLTLAGLATLLLLSSSQTRRLSLAAFDRRFLSK